MNIEDQQILKKFAARVRTYYPGASISAFGSRVHGEAAPDSDLDICVVLNELDQKADSLLTDIAWEIGFEADVVISVVPFSTNEFNTGPLSVSPLVRVIKQEGVAA